DQLLKDGFVVNTILKEADFFCPNSVRINFTIYQYTYIITIICTHQLLIAPSRVSTNTLVTQIIVTRLACYLSFRSFP
ncbi:hypothetical protein EFS29_16120, partial [Lactiplantibacillus plantarum]|nr:hypothetical protein [Lactiplantibacillus plantarum]